MFAVLERGEEKKAVYSKSDIEYLTARGWQPAKEDPKEIPLIGTLKLPKKRKKE